MTQSNRARKRTTAPPPKTDTTATALTGIVSNEQRLARKGTTSGQGNDDARVTVAGRLLGGAAALGMIFGIAFTGTAGANAKPQPQPTLTANGVQPYGGLKDFGPGAKQQFHKPLVAIAATPKSKGYWLAAADGGVFSYGDADFFGSTGNLALVEPVVAIASTPSGNGYWLAAKDGGVFSFGKAKFQGSAAGISDHNVVGIASTPSGNGYWLAAKDGGVFSFGDAEFQGSAAAFGVQSPIVGIAATKTGMGYLLVAADGGVYAFGDAEFHGSGYATMPHDAAGIATLDTGYAIVRSSGSVLTFGTKLPSIGDATVASSDVTTVGMAATANGYWTLQGGRASSVDHMNPFLVCTRKHESSPNPPGYDDGYAAVNPNGRYFGAYQFAQQTWNNTARHAGRLDLVGVNPARASVQDQDELAWDLFLWQGYSPWEHRCLGLR